MLEGSCLCNAVRYQINGKLGPAMMCHCSKCRKASGSAYATNATVKLSDFHLLGGEQQLTEFESTPGVFRAFCNQCGSPLFSRREATPDFIRIRMGTLDTPIDIKPVAHIFVSSKADWDEIYDTLPQYAEMPNR